MTEITTSLGLAPESRPAYTSTKATPMMKTKKMHMVPSMPRMGGMRKNGAVEATMPKSQSVLAPNPASGATKFAMGKKWTSHHGTGGAAKALGCDGSGMC